MIRLNDIRLPLDYTEESLRKAAALQLRLPADAIRCVSLYKRSIDARKKDRICFLASLDVKLHQNEKGIASKCRNATVMEEYFYSLPSCRKLDKRPVIIGSGPCGLFAGLILAQAGQCPILVERGRDVDRRTADVAAFRTGGILNTSSNIQFGEGGAGTFSDGKLNTGTKDSRIRKVLLEFAAHGAPEEILYLAKPHIGTDKLKQTVRNLRKTITRLGGTYLFETTLSGLRIKDGTITGAELTGPEGKTLLETEHVILAVGHSARDTFVMLQQQRIAMEQKPFAMGVRIEHLQEAINRSQYGSFAGHPALGAADYKLAVHLPDGRGVFTFCMCPGGTVVAAASEEGQLVTNGMSEFARNQRNANAALLVSITPEDFGSSDLLAGVNLQRQWERAAYRLGGENYHAPVQRVCDFLQHRPSSSFGAVLPSYTPGVTPTDLDRCLPSFMTDALRAGIVRMDRRLHGFADGDAVLTAVESRSSSPVRILRDASMQSVSCRGLFPCGEGAGYAGGIMSAAVDGIKAAEQILLSTLRPV